MGRSDAWTEGGTRPRLDGREREPAHLAHCRLLSALALGVLAAVSYLPALAGGFVWDDAIFVEEPVIRAASGLKNIWFSFADIKQEGHYWPLVYSSFWLEHKLWGLAPAGYHAVNVALHLVNCLLLWRLLLRLRVPGAVVIAAVFAVHPVHVESVAWIIERKDVLSALFYLSAVLVWTRFAEAPSPGRYALALALFTAGLLSKSVVVTLPVALAIWHWWRYGKVTPIDLLRLAPFVAVAVAITVPDLAFYASREPLELGYSLAERALIAARALWFYAGTLVWPAELAVVYPRWEVDAGDPWGWAYLAAAAALAAGLWLARRRIGRGPLAGALFFAVTLGPVLGFVDYGYLQFSFVADRFQYLACIGVLTVLIGGAAHGVGRLPDRLRSVRIGAWALTAVAVAALGALTWRQAGVYRDEITLFSHVVAHNPAARDAHLNLGNALIKAGRNEEALAAGRIAVEQRPESADAHSNLGAAQMNLEQFEAAASRSAARWRSTRATSGPCRTRPSCSSGRGASPRRSKASRRCSRATAGTRWRTLPWGTRCFTWGATGRRSIRCGRRSPCSRTCRWWARCIRSWAARHGSWGGSTRRRSTSCARWRSTRRPPPRFWTWPACGARSSVTGRPTTS